MGSFNRHVAHCEQCRKTPHNPCYIGGRILVQEAAAIQADIFDAMAKGVRKGTEGIRTFNERAKGDDI